MLLNPQVVFVTWLHYNIKVNNAFCKHLSLMYLNVNLSKDASNGLAGRQVVCVGGVLY